MRAQVVTNICRATFQEELNAEYKAILEKGWIILDTEFSTAVSDHECVEYSALIIYEEKIKDTK